MVILDFKSTITKMKKLSRRIQLDLNWQNKEFANKSEEQKDKKKKKKKKPESQRAVGYH